MRRCVHGGGRCKPYCTLQPSIVGGRGCRWPTAGSSTDRRPSAAVRPPAALGESIRRRRGAIVGLRSRRRRATQPAATAREATPAVLIRVTARPPGLGPAQPGSARPGPVRRGAMLRLLMEGFERPTAVIPSHRSVCSHIWAVLGPSPLYDRDLTDRRDRSVTEP